MFGDTQALLIRMNECESDIYDLKDKIFDLGLEIKTIKHDISYIKKQMDGMFKIQDILINVSEEILPNQINDLINISDSEIINIKEHLKAIYTALKIDIPDDLQD